MSTDQNILKKGLKFIFGAIPLIIFAPVTINIGFSAIKKDDNYIFIIIGFIAAITAIGLVMNGIRIVLKALFN
ncbi:DUF6095 family protein [Flavicella sp.]|uniref:DUF6095 family protein n=1 Tax=Flavicella sp. TaxID=2957742 RepID=UPI003015CBBD